MVRRAGVRRRRPRACHAAVIGRGRSRGRRSPPLWVALGAAEPIEAAVAAALSAVAQPERDARESLRDLDELVFAPIRRRLGPTDHFLLSLDDALHLVPFAALVDEDGRYLVESLLITYVTSGRDRPPRHAVSGALRCNTGVGEVAQSEGVYGLRRALVIAGAETQVVSLWKVDDDATSQLMDCYYSGLRSGEGRSEALRCAQIELLRNGRHAHPFYWAAFVPIGDERPLQLDPPSWPASRAPTASAPP